LALVSSRASNDQCESVPRKCGFLQQKDKPIGRQYPVTSKIVRLRPAASAYLNRKVRLSLTSARSRRLYTTHKPEAQIFQVAPSSSLSPVHGACALLAPRFIAGNLATSVLIVFSPVYGAYLIFGGFSPWQL
jgi:hypothetical protein